MKNIKGNTYYYDSAVCIGGFIVNHELLMIDSGNDGSSAKKALKDFDEINVRYLFNTHSHADHCGGNSFISKRYNSNIIASEIEDSFIRYPVLESSYLYGAAPPSLMKNKFLYAKPSDVDIVIKDEKELELKFGDKEYLFRFIPLNGHSPNMHGIITPDNIVFLGDALLGTDFLEKHGLMFSYDVKSHLKSLESLRNISADGYVLAHGGYKDSIETLIDLNRKSLNNISSLIIDFCLSGTVTFDDLHTSLYSKLDLRENLSLNVLNRSIIRAHVQYLHEEGEVELFCDSGRLLIRRCKRE